jgi:PAS domain S-box-containing protein
MCKELSLLYIEDDVDLQDSMVELLSQIFDDIATAQDGEEGLELLTSRPFDVIITDLTLPKLGNKALLQAIRSQNRDIGIIVTSAHNDVQTLLDCIESDISGYLIKPVMFDALFKALKKVVMRVNIKKSLDENLSLVHQYHYITDKSAIVSKTDVNGIITYVNDKFCKLSGYTPNELIGKNHNIVRHPSSESEMFENLWYTIKVEKKSWQGIIKNITKEGKTTYLQTTINPIFDRNGNISEYIAIRYDVTDMMHPKKQFIDYINNTQKPFVTLIKMEDYENLHSFFGETLVDKLASAFTKRFCGILLHTHIESKFIYLGDGIFGFALSLDSYDKDIQTLIDIMKRFQNTVYNAKLETAEITHDISVHISIAYDEDVFDNALIGIQNFPQHKQEFFIANGLSKKEKKDAQNNIKTLQIVKKAIDSGNVICHYQPIIENKTKNITKYETLIRIKDGSQMLPPGVFLDIAKKANYYPQLTSIVLAQAFETLRKVDKEISINLSMNDIQKKSDKERIIHILNRHKDIAHRVVFEILEDETDADYDLFFEFVSQVKGYGVQIAIDDFGSGYSNFERFVHFQPDIIKIDGSLIKNIHKDEFALSVVKTINTFAKEQQIKTVAEFVENETIYNIITEVGIDFSQGYFFGKPQQLSL